MDFLFDLGDEVRVTFKAQNYVGEVKGRFKLSGINRYFVKLPCKALTESFKESDLKGIAK